MTADRLDDAPAEAQAEAVTTSCCTQTTPMALATLLDKRSEYVAFVTRQVRDAALAEDLVQASLVKAAERIDQLEAAESVNAWFYRMLRNAIVDHRRRSGAHARATEAFGAEQTDVVEAAERAPRVCRCVSRVMATLKPEYVEALQRVEIDETSVKSFAEEKDIAANNAAVRLFRAREALKKKLEAACGSCAEGGGCFDCTCAASE